MESRFMPIRQRITQALADIEMQNRHLNNPPGYSQAAPQSGEMPQAVPMPPSRPNIAGTTYSSIPSQAVPMQGYAGQPLNIVPGNAEAMNFAGAKGPQWTDAEYQNFWNRVGNNG